MKYRILFLFFVMVVFSCKLDIVPEGILSKEKMVAVLIDQHLAEPLYVQRFTLAIPDSNAVENLYLSILKKHKISRKQFEESIFYYGKHPDQYKKIYNQVLDRLNAMDIKVQKENPAIKK